MKKLIWIFLLHLPSIASAQPAPTRAEIRKVTLQIGDTLGRDYVMAGRRKELRTELFRRLESGRYDTISSWQSYIKTLTRDLRAIGQDNHLYLMLREPFQTANSAGGNHKAENYGFEEVRVLPGGVGYLRLTEFALFKPESLTAFAATANFLKSCQAIILDLRGNTGGGSDYGPVLESWFLPAQTELLCFFSIYDADTTCATTLTELPGAPRTAAKLYLLTDSRTGSAAEALAYALQTHGRATLVGARTSGSAHRNTYYTLNDYIDLSVSTGAPVSPITKTNWEGVGIEPNTKVDPQNALGAAYQLACKALGLPIRLLETDK